MVKYTYPTVYSLLKKLCKEDTMYDLRPFIKDIKKIVDRHYLGEPGKYARWITQDAKNSRDLGAIPYGCANAANIPQHFLTETEG